MNILFITSSNLRNPKRGTPLRAHSLLEQINKEHKLLVCAEDIEDVLKDRFESYPKKNGSISKLRYFTRLIKNYKIDVVFVVTELGIKLPVILKILCGTKIVIDLHGLYAEELKYKKVSWFTRFYFKNIVRQLLRYYDLVFVVSEKLKSYYKDINSNIEVVYGGVCLDKVVNKQYRENIGGKSLSIGYMGNARHYQGLDFLLDVSRKIKQKKLFKFKINLVLSGNKELILEKIKKFDLKEDVILNFNIRHEDVFDIMVKSDALVIPRPSLTMTEYAYPSKLPECLATKIPVILTDVGPVRELLGEQKFCFVISKHDIVNDLLAKLNKVNKMNCDMRRAMGERAYFFIKNKLTWDVQGTLVNQYLKKLK